MYLHPFKSSFPSSMALLRLKLQMPMAKSISLIEIIDIQVSREIIAFNTVFRKMYLAFYFGSNVLSFSLFQLFDPGSLNLWTYDMRSWRI
jgi:hypothetical protein